MLQNQSHVSVGCFFSAIWTHNSVPSFIYICLSHYFGSLTNWFFFASSLASTSFCSQAQWENDKLNLKCSLFLKQGLGTVRSNPSIIRPNRGPFIQAQPLRTGRLLFLSSLLSLSHFPKVLICAWHHAPCHPIYICVCVCVFLCVPSKVWCPACQIVDPWLSACLPSWCYIFNESTIVQRTQLDSEPLVGFFFAKTEREPLELKTCPSFARHWWRL